MNNYAYEMLWALGTSAATFTAAWGVGKAKNYFDKKRAEKLAAANQGKK